MYALIEFNPYRSHTRDGVSEVMVIRMFLGRQTVQPHQQFVVLIDPLHLRETNIHYVVS